MLNEGGWAALKRKYKAGGLYSNKAVLNARLGQFPEAEAEVKRAQQLDPLSPIINMAVAEVYAWERHYETSRNTTACSPRLCSLRQHPATVPRLKSIGPFSPSTYRSGPTA
jgi:hypothetical protein